MVIIVRFCRLGPICEEKMSLERNLLPYLIKRSLTHQGMAARADAFTEMRITVSEKANWVRAPALSLRIPNESEPQLSL
jgi:hypothetical protein